MTWQAVLEGVTLGVTSVAWLVGFGRAYWREANRAADEQGVPVPRHLVGPR